MKLDLAVRQLLDHQRVCDTLYRYASTIDDKDTAGLRALFADDAIGRYGQNPVIHGADEIVAWIAGRTLDCTWQHHKLTVYHVDIDGDAARALTYHTSHQITAGEPDTVSVIVGRYRDVLRRAGDGWQITDKTFEYGWVERRVGPNVLVSEPTR